MKLPDICSPADEGNMAKLQLFKKFTSETSDIQLIDIL
jgi:hypothetical protein